MLHWLDGRDVEGDLDSTNDKDVWLGSFEGRRRGGGRARLNRDSKMGRYP